MNISIIRAAFAVAITLAFQATMASGTNVCSAKHDGDQSTGESVSFQGRILSDGVHSTLIFPDKCQNIGFPIAPDDVENSPAAIIRQSIMKIGSPGTVDKTITVEVDAEITVIGNHRIGLKIIKLKQLVLTYSNDS